MDGTYKKSSKLDKYSTTSKKHVENFGILAEPHIMEWINFLHLTPTAGPAGAVDTSLAIGVDCWPPAVASRRNSDHWPVFGVVLEMWTILILHYDFVYLIHTIWYYVIHITSTYITLYTCIKKIRVWQLNIMVFVKQDCTQSNRLRLLQRMQSVHTLSILLNQSKWWSNHCTRPTRILGILNHFHIG